MPVDHDNPVSADAIRRRSRELAASEDAHAEGAELLAAISDGTLTFNEVDEQALRRCMETFGPDAVMEAFFEAEAGAGRQEEQKSSEDAKVAEVEPVSKQLLYMPKKRPAVHGAYGWHQNRAAWSGVAAAVLFLGVMIFEAARHHRAPEDSIARLSPAPTPLEGKPAQVQPQRATQSGEEIARRQPPSSEPNRQPAGRQQPAASSATQRVDATQPANKSDGSERQRSQTEKQEILNAPASTASSRPTVEPSAQAAASVPPAVSPQGARTAIAAKPSTGVSSSGSFGGESTPGHAAKFAGIASPAGLSKRRIAVLDFDYATVKTQAYAQLGADEDIGKGISALLVKQLADGGDYVIVEPSAIDKILKEQGFSSSDRADPARSAQIGRLLGVDAVVIGDVTSFGGASGGNGFIGFSAGKNPTLAGSSSVNKNNTAVEIKARVVDVKTGEVVASVAGKGEIERKGVASGIFGGARLAKPGVSAPTSSGSFDMGSSNFQQTQIGKAVKLAVADLATNLNTQTASPPGNSPAETSPAPPISAASPPPLIFGEPLAQVLKDYGMPAKIIDLGHKKTFYYKDIRIIFVDDKITDVQAQ